jgi:ankyrin repeat protein
MRLLLEKGADPNIATFAGTTALMAAAGVNWAENQTYTESKEALMEALKLCFEKGADVNAKNSMGITAVIGAANRGSDDMLEFLVQKGAKLDVRTTKGGRRWFGREACSWPLIRRKKSPAPWRSSRN